MGGLTHASFFSGVGGLDLGLGRAGWRTVSFSEIDPYASAVLASRWPGVPNLGSIVDVVLDDGSRSMVRVIADAPRQPDARREGWRAADLWSGGFPCQDLSVAGKRRGMGVDGARTRSGLAFAFLDLVERHRPPAILLENVPGLLSSHRGRDLAALLDRLGELGYWWAYRVLDARHFGVPQRRRRVFIVALHARTGAGVDGTAAVLAVGARCGGHLATGGEAREGATSLTGGGADSPQSERVWDAGGPGPTLDTGRAIPNVAYNAYHQRDRVYRDTAPALDAYGDTPSDAPIVMAPAFSKRPGQQIATRDDGLSYSLTSGEPPRVLSIQDGREMEKAQNGLGVSDEGVAYTLDGTGAQAVLGKVHRAASADDAETWAEAEVAFPLNGMDGDRTTLVGGVRRLTPVECERLMGWPDGWTIPNEWKGKTYDGSDLLPLGLDSHRYRCCGNGVVAPVAEWIGARLAATMQALEQAA